ncbi:MAG: universal stress protein [Nitrospirota bacterium]|nr:universal stress protein [Nitrospirota bacterium]
MKILVALDGSEAAFNAMRSACRIAAKKGSYITAFYVNKGVEYSPEETAWTSIKERIDRELETFGPEVIHKAYQIGREFGVSVEGIISDGIPALELQKYMNAHGIIKLIAMGHSSKGRGAQEFVESTTKSVVFQARIPVLVTSSVPDIRRILIALDNLESADRVVAFGGDFARSLGAALSIITVVPDAETLVEEYGLISEVPNIARHMENYEKALTEIAKQTVAKAVASLTAMNMNASSLIKKGEPSDEIMLELRNHDLLIVGIKKGASPKKMGRTINKLLASHSINAIFVQ